MADDDDRRSNDYGMRPVPDPTLLTTEALQREIKALKELLELRVNALDHRFEQRIEDHEKMAMEKFRRVALEFELVERQRVEGKTDTKAAVDAALIAQKEAVREQTMATATAIGKTEAGTAEQLKQLGVTQNIAIAAVQSTLNDLKERVVKLEATKLGSREATTERQQANAGIFALVSLLGLLALVAIAVAGFALAR
jgi:hypothetical protein